MTEESAYSKLANLLSGIEGSLIATTNRAIMADDGAAKSERKVRNIIHARLDAHNSKSNTARPDNIAEKRRLLEIIMGTNPRLPTEIRMSYGGTHKIPDSEVSALLSKLIRSGAFMKRPKK